MQQVAILHALFVGDLVIAILYLRCNTPYRIDSRDGYRLSLSFVALYECVPLIEAAIASTLVARKNDEDTWLSS